MTSLFTLKRQKKTDGSESSTGTENSAPAKKSRLSMEEVRINKDLTDLVLPSTCKIDFPDQNVLSNFNLTISPDEGYYKDGHFVFSFNFGRQYPYVGSYFWSEMIKLFSLKQQKKDGNDPNAKPGQKKATAAQLRVAKDINELSLPKTCQVDFPDRDDLLNFKLIICPDEGFYRGGQFVFTFKIGQAYPHEPPKVKCETTVYHPNIDLEGNICLKILREDWIPMLTVNSIIYGLQYLFLEPNPEDPLNKEAAEVLQSNRRIFEQNVSKSLRGGYVGNTYFERCLK